MASLGNSRPGTKRNPQASSACAYIIIIGTARDASESIMSEWNATAVHYGVLQITAGATRFSGKITGGLSPAVKSGELSLTSYTF